MPNISHDYDIIVIGAGIGGLTAAALLVNRGFKVLVVEQHSKPGGYCSTFRRGPFVFDVAVHMIGGCEDGGLVDQILRSVHVRDRVKFARIDPMYLVVRGNERISVPCDLHEFSTLLTGYAPREEGIKPLLAEIYDIGSDLLGFHSFREPSRAFRALSRVANQSYLDFIVKYVKDERVLALLSSLSTYAGLPPGEIDAGMMITIMSSYHKGAFYPLGSTQALPNALVESITGAGGTVKLRTRVSRILMNKNAAGGVELSRIGKVTARAVISNADLSQTLRNLVGEEHLSASFIHRFQRLHPAASAVNLYLALEGNPGLTHHEVLTLAETHPREWQLFYQPGCSRQPFFFMTSPTLLDASLAPPGGHILIATTLTDTPEVVERFNDAQGKEMIAAELLKWIERLFPSIRSHLVNRRCAVATPNTMIRYTSNTNGSGYGWGKSWTQHWPYRLGPSTPIPRLYIAGHWSRTHGIYGVMNSGKVTAELVEKELRS